MLNMIDKAIRSGVEAGAKAAIPNVVDMALDALWDHPWFSFIVGAQARLIETGMKPREAWDLARTVLLRWASDEKIAFGDKRFDWSPQGGRAVIEACEIEYWDADA